MKNTHDQLKLDGKFADRNIMAQNILLALLHGTDQTAITEEVFEKVSHLIVKYAFAITDAFIQKSDYDDYWELEREAERMEKFSKDILSAPLDNLKKL